MAAEVTGDAASWERHCKKAEAALAEMRAAFDGATPNELRRLRDLEASIPDVAANSHGMGQADGWANGLKRARAIVADVIWRARSGDGDTDLRSIKSQIEIALDAAIALPGVHE